MKTIFGLFTDPRDAKAAINDLLAREFDEKEMGIVTFEPPVERFTADSSAAEKAEQETSEQSVYAAGEPFDFQKTVTIPGLGQAYVAGEMANVLTWASSEMSTADGSLNQALKDFGLPDEVVSAYRKGLIDGATLFFMRSFDERAEQAVRTLRAHQAGHISTHTP